MDINYDFDFSISENSSPKPFLDSKESKNKEIRVPLSIGLISDPPTLILVYEVVKNTSNTSTSGLSVPIKKRRRRKMPLRNFSDKSDILKFIFMLQQRHSEILNQVPQIILEKVLRIIQEVLKGLSIGDAVKAIDQEFNVDGEEDLNKVTPAQLQRKKELMSETFSQNLLRPGDPTYIYDKQVQFKQNTTVVESLWDDEDDESKSTSKTLSNNQSEPVAVPPPVVKEVELLKLLQGQKSPTTAGTTQVPSNKHNDESKLIKSISNDSQLESKEPDVLEVVVNLNISGNVFNEVSVSVSEKNPLPELLQNQMDLCVDQGHWMDKPEESGVEIRNIDNDHKLSSIQLEVEPVQEFTYTSPNSIDELLPIQDPLPEMQNSKSYFTAQSIWDEDENSYQQSNVLELSEQTPPSSISELMSNKGIEPIGEEDHLHLSQGPESILLDHKSHTEGTDVEEGKSVNKDPFAVKLDDPSESFDDDDDDFEESIEIDDLESEEEDKQPLVKSKSPKELSKEYDFKLQEDESVEKDVVDEDKDKYPVLESRSPKEFDFKSKKVVVVEENKGIEVEVKDSHSSIRSRSPQEDDVNLQEEIDEDEDVDDEDFWKI